MIDASSKTHVASAAIVTDLPPVILIVYLALTLQILIKQLFDILIWSIVAETWLHMGGRMLVI